MKEKQIKTETNTHEQYQKNTPDKDKKRTEHKRTTQTRNESKRNGRTTPITNINK